MSETNHAATAIFTIQTLHEGTIEEREDLLAVETPIAIMLDGVELASLMCSPGKEEFLALGFLQGEGLIRTIGEVKSIDYNRTTNSVTIIRTAPDGSSWKKRSLLRTTSGTLTGQAEPPGPARRQDPGGEPASLMALMEVFNRGSELFAQTGCVHSAALSDGLSLLLFADDIGRCNAFDKVAGEALATGLDCTGKILYTSGRISSEIVTKAASLGLAAVVSPSAPTSLAVETAKSCGITLFGFTRGSRSNIYGEPLPGSCLHISPWRKHPVI